MHRHTLRDNAHMEQTVNRLETIIAERGLYPSVVSFMAFSLASHLAARRKNGQDGPYEACLGSMSEFLHLIEASR